MFGISPESIFNTVVPNIPKIMGRGSALDYLGLSRTWGIPVVIYYDKGNIIDSSYVKGVRVNSLDDIPYSLVRGIPCTTPEFALCELLKYGGNPQTINQSLITYNSLHRGDLTDLLIQADLLNVAKQLQAALEIALSSYDEGEL